MRIVDVIIKKRDGKELTDEEIKFVIKELVDGRLESSQLGAMLMAWYFNGMNARELSVLTNTMTHSGDTLSWPDEWKPVLVDKHSTGGVGDKISLILAPALAACGLKVPMVSGRGLGFTGGTLDKLEAIPGFKVDLTLEEMQQCLADSGCCICGQTATLVPADRIMYATRDITGTVENANFVTASIISKKAAENVSALVLDVKVGRASFSQTLDDARHLAKNLVGAARDQGMLTKAVLTSMDHPLGMTVGNSLEVIEAISGLKGKGPEDLNELVAIQGALLLHATGKADNIDQGRDLILETLKNGAALNRFEKMLINQNVQPGVAHELCYGNAESVLPREKYSSPLVTSISGYVVDLDALAIAQVCGALGAARARASDIILPAVGVQLNVKVGQAVVEGQVWGELKHECEIVPKNLWKKLQDAISISLTQQTIEVSRILEIIE
ncbi:hypothetical protein OUZ56_007431 [Daphnia magna]|uniref:Thymidine phosphorylase n=1 Tax=Daphnia magna TaxID=35525 RepID=A0ABR0AAD1_9CRUS|nr:hypothetical protein OUZ56_007431 [Daphnia magna]